MFESSSVFKEELGSFHNSGNLQDQAGTLCICAVQTLEYRAEKAS